MTQQLASRSRSFRRASSVGIAWLVLATSSSAAFAEPETKVWPLTNISGLRTNGVKVAASRVDGRDAVRVRLESDFDFTDANTYALVTDSEFQNGTIEVDVSSRVDPEAWFFVRWLARGFAGLTFRSDEQGRFESLYLRPLNGRVDDETRRAHAVQYISYPDWDFGRFREESPGRYEGPADIGPNEWIHIRIEVDGGIASLFLDDNETPVLVVKDLKLGPDQRGKVGLWVGPGTIAHFSNLKVTPKP